MPADKVTDAVMKDAVVKAAIDHVGDESSPSRMAAEMAEQSETSLRNEGRRSELALLTKGQRDINRVWESTQMRLALITVGGFMSAHTFVVVILTIILIRNWRSLSDDPTSIAVLVAILTASLGAIASIASLVIGFYFGRTNHQRVGGPGGDSAGTR